MTIDQKALISRLIREEVRGLCAYRVPPAGGLVKLDAMENPYVLPPELVEGWSKRLTGLTFNRYPDPEARALKSRLREVMDIPAGMEVLLGNGSDELIQLVLLALSGPDRVVMAPDPSFSMYALLSRALGFRFVPVPLDPASFELPCERMLETMERYRPAVVFLAYPNNPTGNLFDSRCMQAIIERSRGLVVVDEAYAPFARRTFLGDLSRYPNLIVLRTLSKLGMAGLRVGMLIGAPAWVEELNKLRLPYNINVLSQASADFALEHIAVFNAQADRIRADREDLFARLQGLDGVQVWPSDANFLLVRVPAGRAAGVVTGLEARGVRVKNLHGTSTLLEDCLRLTVGRADENRLLLEALGDVL